MNPNFRVIDAMKSELSTLCDALPTHPEIFIVEPFEYVKEAFALFCMRYGKTKYFWKGFESS